MVSNTVMILATSLLLPTTLAGGSSPPECQVRVYDNPSTWGASHTYREGSHSSLGSWNDRIEAVEVFGGDGCWAQLCQHSNFRGQCTGRIPNDVGVRFPSGSEIANQISSIRVGLNRRRAEDEEVVALPDGAEVYTVEHADLEETYDPLCEAVYHELTESRGQMFANATIAHWEMERLVENCEDSLTYDASFDVDRCKFYVYAATEILDNENILDILNIDEPKAHDMMEEYQRCGLLNGQINKFVETGKFSGVKIQEHEGEDYFVLDEPLTADSVDLVPNDGTFSAVVSAGSLLAMWIGSTMIRVCRDFDAETGYWLRAAMA